MTQSAIPTTGIHSAYTMNFKSGQYDPATIKVFPRMHVTRFVKTGAARVYSSMVITTGVNKTVFKPFVGN